MSLDRQHVALMARKMEENAYILRHFATAPDVTDDMVNTEARARTYAIWTLGQRIRESLPEEPAGPQPRDPVERLNTVSTLHHMRPLRGDAA